MSKSNFVVDGFVIMTSIVYPRNIFLFSLLFLLLSFDAGAQNNVVFSANASASRIGIADQLQITYTIQDLGEAATFNTGAALKDFRVLAGPFRSQSTNMQAVGNQIVQSSALSLTFIVQAKHTGVIKLAPAIVVDNSGHSYKSNPLQVEVVGGSVASARGRRQSPGNGWEEDDPFGGDPFAAMRAQQARMRQLMSARMAPASTPQQSRTAAPKTDLGKDIFIRVNVDKKDVKLGEQVTAVYKLYARIPMQVAISKLPSLNGFWTQDFDIPKQQKPVEEIVDGKRYQVFVLKKSALFPQQAGTLTLDAAEAEGVAHLPVQNHSSSPFDDPFFQQAFGSLMMNDPFYNDPFREEGFQEVPVQLKSAPVRIQVSALPESGKPADFTGAVGKFSLAGKLDKTSLTTDNVATLTLTISGSGNLKLFDAPKINLPDGLDTYAPNVFDTVTGRTTTISGQKVITYSIAPRRAGDYVIPPLSLSWYDPQSGTYHTTSTGPFHLQVTPGKAAVAATSINGGGSGDIDDRFLPATSRPLILSPLYWSMYAVPLLLLLGITFYRRREDGLIADSAQQRIRLANKVAQKRLALAGTMLQRDDVRGFYDEISKAIWLYLSDKLNIPLSSLGKSAALQAMGQHGVPTPVQQQIEKVLSECELALYASSGSNYQMQQTFSEAACIITGLERTLRPS